MRRNSDNAVVKIPPFTLAGADRTCYASFTMAKGLYETLGLKRDASEKEVRSAYRRLARKFHPDVAPNDPGAEAKFKEMNAAFDVLGDPEKRKKYDKYGDRWENADQIEEAHKRQSAGSWARNGSGGFAAPAGAEGDTDFGGIFDSLFRGGRGGPPQPRRGQDLEAPVELTLEEAAAGTTRVLQLAAESGDRRLEVKVPHGVRTGSRVRVAGEGGAGMAGGRAGDIFLVVNVLPHARFERKGDDLIVEVDVPYTEAILGGEAEVPTLTGRVMLRLPELTQNGRQFRLGGKGMPILGQPAKHGDLIARIRVQLPDHLSDEERQHIEALRTLRQPVPAAAGERR